MRNLSITLIFLLICSTINAQNEVASEVANEVTETVAETFTCPTPDSLLVVGTDTFARPMPDSLLVVGADSVAPVKKKGFFNWIANYLKNTNKKSDKPFDMSLIAGPSYSASTSFCIGLIACGLYSWDRQDSTLHKSNMSIYATVGVTGLFGVGVEGKNFTKHNRWHLNYLLAFAHLPTRFWGIGYEKGHYDNKYFGSYRGFTIQFKPDALYNLGRNCFLGPMVDFEFMNTFDKTYLPDGANPFLDADGTDLPTTTINLGLGGMFNYDSRDFPLNAHKGIFLNVQGLYYPKMGSYNTSFGSAEVNFCQYFEAWKNCVIAYQLHGKYTFGKVPWTKLAKLGGSYSMRAYYLGQFRDESIVEGMLEFRQRIWKRIGATAWIGAGNVFGREAYSWGHWLPDIGLGFRWEFKERVNVRIDCSFGKADSKGNTTWNICFNINEAF